jgi:exopolysaccharide production protein ExoQ
MRLLIDNNPAPPPGRWEAVIFLLVLLIQQNAFLSIPMLVNGMSMGEMRGTENIYNSVAIGATAAFLAWETRRHGRQLLWAVRRNLSILLFAGLVVLSTLWSIHPGITLRRAFGYLLTLAIAALLPLRFGVTGFMKVLSASLAVSAIGSAVYALVLPQYGIMHVADLEGCWQGVFATKELLGSVMAVAVLVELYNLLSSNRWSWWRAGLVLFYITLILLSRSITALGAAGIYLLGSLAYFLRTRYQWRGLVLITINAAVLVLAVSAFQPEPQAVLRAVGKDPTLTGRVYLWHEVERLIGEKPILGWGYRAMWQPGDRATSAIDSMVGFEAPSSHNAYLEVALGLGWAGVLALSIVILTALRRGVQCCRHNSPVLGWFTVMFVAGCIVSGVTNESMGMNQVIDWLVFNALLVACGIAIQSGPAKNERPSRIAGVHV